MKTIVHLGFIGLLVIAMLSNGYAQTLDSIVMGNGYSNEIYYSLKNGEIKSEPRSNWGIAFYTSVFSAGIITNGANGVELYAYPNGDTSAWNSMDTTGLSSWPTLYNSEEDWQIGAFNRNGFGQMDYGWGVYNVITHNLTGDSLFVIKLANGSYKKIWIVTKYSSLNKYVFRYGNLDNTDEVEKEYDIMPYTSKNFVYYSFETESLIDREPAKDSWDIVLTKYIAEQPTGGVYPVTGFLNNEYIANNRFYPVPVNFMDWTSAPFDTLKTGIGFNWKDLDFITFTYVCVDSLVFFVQGINADVYKLLFKSFEIGTGKTVFEKEMISLATIGNIEGSHDDLTIAPNPVVNNLNFKYAGSSDNMNVSVYDLTGRIVLAKQINSNGSSEYSISSTQLKNGLYFLVISTSDNTITQKFIVRK